MWELYFILKLDALIGLFLVLFAVSSLSLFIMSADDDIRNDKKNAKYFRTALIVCIVSFVSMFSIPSTKQALTIIGVGETIEYL